MSLRLVLAAAICVAAALPAAAQGLTPDALWRLWQAGGGVTLQAGEAREDGGALLLEDVVLSVGDGGDAARIALDTLRLSPEGEAVRIVPSDTASLTVPGPRAPVTGTIAGLAGGEVLARRTGDQVAYSLALPRMTAALEGLGGPAADRPGAAVLTVDDLDATLTPGADGVLAVTLDAARVAADATSGADRSSYRLGYDDVSGRFTGTPAALSAVAGGGALAATRPVEIEVTRGPGRLEATMPDGATPETLRIESDEAGISLTAQDGRAAYEGRIGATRIGVQGGVPSGALSLSLGGARIATDLPLLPADDPQDASLSFEIDALMPGPQVWALFDPQGALPRDPARLVLDLSGDVMLAEPLAASGTRAGPPRALSLTIERFEFGALGAQVTGQGAFAFAGTPGPGQPLGRPTGEARVEATGVNALLNTLSQTGILPDGPALGARMALGFFARAGETPDSLVSEFRIGEDGNILLNGNVAGQLPAP
ncbi:DUF2125 domain-containing protein [Palleronia sediminis]|nr:DUF2125 domain-containing protein [Palleronia sediminis]